MVEISIDLSDNDIQYIEPGAFKHGKGTSELVINYNYNLGLQNAQNILNDFENKELHSLYMKECGIVIDIIDGKLFKVLKTSKLNILDISGNTIKTLAADAFEPIKSLQKLTISNFMYTSNFTFNILQNLTDFRLFGGIQKSTALIPTLDLSGLQHLKHLRLYLSDSTTMNIKMRELPHLRSLRLIDANDFEGYRHQVIQLLKSSKSIDSIGLDGNNLFKYTDHELCHLFENKSYVEGLSLTRNYLTHLPGCLFKGMFKLLVLFLSKNRIMNIQNDLFKDLYSLRWLDLSDNALMFMDPGNFAHMPTLERLHIQHNSFNCNCELIGLRDVLNGKLNKPKWAIGRLIGYFEKCSIPESLKHEFIHNYTIPWIECNSGLVITVSSATGGSLIFLTILTLVLLHHYRKDIKYIKMVRQARKHEGYAPIQDIPYEDDAFVSYHSDKQLWIQRDMCRELENGDDIKFTLMYDDRIMPGGSFFTSLGNAMYSCRKIILVVSRGWVEAALNQFEMDMALATLLDDHKDMIIVLLMEHIPKAEMSDTLRMMVKHNTCLKWSDNERQ
ncbi:unnamed protein product, partial [Owenia fusiformis]